MRARPIAVDGRLLDDHREVCPFGVARRLWRVTRDGAVLGDLQRPGCLTYVGSAGAAV